MRVFFVVIGGVLLVVASLMAWQSRAFLASASRATGVVTATPAGGSHPLVQFTTADGRVVSFAQGGFIFGYHPGDAVAVVYDAANPSRAMLDTVGAIWFLPIFLGALGGLFLLVALLSAP